MVYDPYTNVKNLKYKNIREMVVKSSNDMSIHQSSSLASTKILAIWMRVEIVKPYIWIRNVGKSMH